MIELHPDIENMDTNSLCYSIYNQLYSNFFNSQIQKSDSNPNGIEEGDVTSIRLKNTAYGFASAISGSVSGGEGDGGVLIDYLKKSGGNMIGLLRSNYGLEAGFDNRALLQVAENGVTVLGNLHIGADSLFIANKQFIRYDSIEKVLHLENTTIDFGVSQLKSTGRVTIGNITIFDSIVLVGDKNIYHEGNANLASINWQMKDANILGTLSTTGQATFKNTLSARYGVTLGANGKTILSLSDKNISVSGFLSFSAGYGIKIASQAVLMRVNDTDIQLSGIDGDLILGNESTNQIRLFTGISDIDGDNILITKYGGAYFPSSLRVQHNYGEDLLSTYRIDSTDEGIVIHKKLRFGSSLGTYLHGDNEQMFFISGTNKASFRFIPSVSLYKPQNRESTSFVIATNCDFIILDKPIEAQSIGINGTLTKLTDGALFFTEQSRILAVNGGLKYFGHGYFLSGISSERFSSGFSGYGWAILPNLTTGNMVATFDELTVRKKMRVYEFEVQKVSITNGALWVSDHCSADFVEQLE